MFVRLTFITTSYYRLTLKQNNYEKKFSFLPALLLLSFTTKVPVANISDTERKFAIDLLLQTEAGVNNNVSGLSDAQLNFKPAPYKWSVADCMKHIAVTEAGL